MASAVRSAFGLDAAQVVLGHREASTAEVYAEADRRLGELVAIAMG